MGPRALRTRYDGSMGCCSSPVPQPVLVCIYVYANDDCLSVYNVHEAIIYFINIYNTRWLKEVIYKHNKDPKLIALSVEIFWYILENEKVPITVVFSIRYPGGRGGLALVRLKISVIIFLFLYSNTHGWPEDTMSFTAHAAVHLKQRHQNNSRITDGDYRAQLVECTRFEDRARIENLVHLTFPVVSTQSFTFLNF